MARDRTGYPFITDAAALPKRGTSNRRSILAPVATALPCPVLIRLTLGSTVVKPREHVGLLLEWKQVTDDRGVRSWRGLVVYAMPGVGKEGSWELSQRWMTPECLTPIAGRP